MYLPTLIGLCSWGVGRVASILEALIFFVGAFTLITTCLLTHGLVFIGLNYAVVYMGAIAVVFVFAVLAIDTHRASVNLGPKSSSNGIPAAVAGGFTGGVLSEGLYLFATPSNNPSLQGEEVLVLTGLIFNEAPLILIGAGLILLFAMIGPVKA